MKIVIFLVLPVVIALTLKYVSIASETLRQVRQGKDPEIDPMQSAVLPELIAIPILSIVCYVIVNIFAPESSVKYVAWGQLGIIFILLLFALKYWWALKKVQP